MGQLQRVFEYEGQTVRAVVIDGNPYLFEIKEFARGDFAGTQTLITPKGRETFRLLLKEALA